MPKWYAIQMDTKEKIAVVGILTAAITGWRSELKPFIVGFWDGLTPWRFFFVISLGYLIWWWIDRRALKRKDWLRESKAATDSAIAEALATVNKGISSLNIACAVHERAMAANAIAFDAKMAHQSIEQTRSFKETVYYAVLDQAGAIIQQEVSGWKEADAALERRLKAIEDRLPPVGVS